jgi:hypothetical protein
MNVAGIYETEGGLVLCRLSMNHPPTALVGFEKHVAELRFVVWFCVQNKQFPSHSTVKKFFRHTKIYSVEHNKQ